MPASGGFLQGHSEGFCLRQENISHSSVLCYDRDRSSEREVETERMGNRILIKNGNCMTMEQGPRCEWVLLEEDKIVKLGNGDGYRQYETEGIRQIDAAGATVLPGFIDNHFHLINSALMESWVNLEGADTFTEMGERLRCACAEGRKVVLAYNLSVEELKEKRFPSRIELDRICDDRPVFLLSRDVHTIVLNTFAILYYKMPFAANGVGLDDRKMPTGIFRGQAAALLETKVNEIFTPEDFDEATQAFLPALFCEGITTIAAMEGSNHLTGHGHDSECDFLVKNAARYPLSIELFYQTTDVRLVADEGLRRIGGALYIDGTFGTHSASLTTDYADMPGVRGYNFFTDGYMRSFVEECCENGLQIGFDAIGDAAIDSVLDALEYAARKRNVRPMRHRIEHAELIRIDQMEKAARLGVVLCMQPGYEARWGFPGGMYEERLGARYGETNRFREILDHGITICGGSDHSVCEISPMVAISSAVNHPVPENSITRQEALEMYTINGAYALFLEEERGSIAEGKAADLIILDRNLDEVSDSDLAEVKVDLTIKNGEIIYERTDAC